MKVMLMALNKLNVLNYLVKELPVPDFNYKNCRIWEEIC